MARALGDDGRFRRVNERRVEKHIRIAVERVVLHRLKAPGEAGAAIGVDEMIAAMDGGGDGLVPLCRGEAKGDAQHDGVAIGYDRGGHRGLGVMAVGHRHIIGERRAGQHRADAAHVDEVKRHPEPVGRAGGEVELFAMALAIVKGDQPRECLLCRDLVGEGNGIQSA